MKVITCLSIEPEILTLAKAKINNISSFVEALLKVEIGLESNNSEQFKLNELKLINAKLLNEISRLTKDITEKDQENKALQLELKQAREEKKEDSHIIQRIKLE